MSLALMLFAASAAVAPAGVTPPTVDVSVSPREISIGDVFTAQLTVRMPATELVGPPLFPDWGSEWGPAEVRSVGLIEPLPEEDGQAIYRQTLSLAVFETGEIELPPVTLEAPAPEGIREVVTAPTAFEVRSVLPADVENPEPKPPAPPLHLKIGRKFWWTVGVLAALCALGVALLLRRRILAEALGSSMVDPLTTFEQALLWLQSEKDPEVLFTGLSLALRRYLGGSLLRPTAESTTTEIRALLRDAGLPRPLVIRIDKLLRRCDQVKFARDNSHSGSAQAPVAETHAIAQEVESFLVPTQEEEGTEEAA